MGGKNLTIAPTELFGRRRHQQASELAPERVEPHSLERGARESQSHDRSILYFRSVSSSVNETPARNDR